VRLGSKTQNEFLNELGQKSARIGQLFQQNMADLTKPITIHVMLGDTTVTDQTTFDPQHIHEFYDKIINRLTAWKTDGISATSDEDLRRVFVKLERQIGNYVLLWHLSLQYHALLYYKPDNKVQNIQKELAELIEHTADKEKEIADLTDSMIKEKLKAFGYDIPNEQNLFEILYNDERLRQEIVSEIDKKTDFDFKAKDKRKTELFKELDNLLIETYQTTSVLLDENRLITGEEGCLSTIDLDLQKKKTKNSIFDPKRIPIEARQSILNSLDEIIQILSA
jgi:hypothetical protein